MADAGIARIGARRRRPTGVGRRLPRPVRGRRCGRHSRSTISSGWRLSAHMVGRPDETARAWERAHHAAVGRRRSARARGARRLPPDDGPRPAGRVRPGRRLASPARPGSSTRPVSTASSAATCSSPRRCWRCRPATRTTAFGLFERVAALAERFGDRDLATFGRLGRGQSLIAMGEAARGVAFLDEAMLAVTPARCRRSRSGSSTAPSSRRAASCSTCAVRRSGPRRSARWCDAQPDLVPFRGKCLVYRAEIMGFHGQWQRCRPRGAARARLAVAAAARAGRRRGASTSWPSSIDCAARSPRPRQAIARPAAGAGCPSPVLRCSGSPRATSRPPRHRSAGRSTRRSAWPAPGCSSRSSRSARRPATSRPPATAADELAALADRSGAAAAARDGRPGRWRGPARGGRRRGRRSPCCARPGARWRELDAPYESARVRVQIGRACRAARRRGRAALEFDAARRGVRGARGDARTWRASTRLVGGAARRSPGGLSRPRGRGPAARRRRATNRAIAEELTISERTVDRHVSNIYTKLDVSHARRARPPSPTSTASI